MPLRRCCRRDLARFTASAPGMPTSAARAASRLITFRNSTTRMIRIATAIRHRPERMMLRRRLPASLRLSRHADRNIQTPHHRRARPAPRGPKGRPTCTEARGEAQTIETHPDDGETAPHYCEPLVGWRTWRALERDVETYLATVFRHAR